jgi:hypothetical protein
MFSQKTVFVVGAGASAEVGLPIGRSLATAISRLFTYRTEFGRLVEGDADFLAAMRTQFPNSNTFDAHMRAGRQIASGIGLVNSIDNYIDTHRNDPAIAVSGKAAIAYAILRAEASSSLFVDTSRDNNRQINFSRIENSWFIEFANMLSEGVPVDNIDKLFNNVSFICFNYDRCIQHFLANWIAAVYVIDLGTAHQLVSRLRILRPYGVVAPIYGDEQSVVAFGSSPTKHNIGRLRDGIRTYTEQINDPGLLSEIKGELASAEIVVFLGFAFHPQNMKLLAPTTSMLAKRIVASAYGISAPNVASIHSEIRALAGRTPKQTKGPPTVALPTTEAWQVMRDYRRDILALDVGRRLSVT